MRLSLIVEADYNDLSDREALTREHLAQSLKILAARIEDDYKNRKSEQNKYGVFYQHYTVDTGSKYPKRLRHDSASQEIVNQTQLNLWNSAPIKTYERPLISNFTDPIYDDARTHEVVDSKEI